MRRQPFCIRHYSTNLNQTPRHSLEGAKAAVNNYIDSDVNRFNAMVADYNSRCGSFRIALARLKVRREIAPK